MPIYAYKCESCGFSKDLLQKMSDPPLSDCPSCGASSFKKQVTAAGFQLKGSGWYATDFKGSGAPAPVNPEADAGSAEAKRPADGEAKPAEGAANKPVETTAKPTAAPAAAPKTASGGATP